MKALTIMQLLLVPDKIKTLSFSLQLSRRMNNPVKSLVSWMTFHCRNRKGVTLPDLNLKSALLSSSILAIAKRVWLNQKLTIIQRKDQSSSFRSLILMFLLHPRTAKRSTSLEVMLLKPLDSQWIKTPKHISFFLEVKTNRFSKKLNHPSD